MRLVLLCVVALVPLVFGQDYIVPEPTFEIHHPKGFSVSIPDDGNIKLFAFHGNINREILNREAGQFSVDITRAQNGRWTFTDKSARFNVGDVIYYWLYVIHNDGRGYLREDESYTVQGTCKIYRNCTQAPTAPTKPEREPIDQGQVQPDKLSESDRQLQRQVLSEHLELIRLQKELIVNTTSIDNSDILFPIYQIDVRQSGSKNTTPKSQVTTDILTELTDQELYRKVLTEQLDLIRLLKERVSKSES